VWKRPVSLVHGRVVTESGIAGTLRFGATVLSIDEPPRRGDVVIDLDGAFVLPGLINAHDHLELNHYGPQKCRDRYVNVSEWIDDMRPRLRQDPVVRRGAAHPLSERLFIGVLKNLLSGVTSVAHHNPYYRELRRHTLVRVVRRYGWAHSFGLEHQPAGANGEMGGEVTARFLDTPPGAPFLVHLGEGVDDTARMELDRLDGFGCLAPQTVLIHGVAIDEGGWRRVESRGAGLVWCPASNQFLFGDAARAPVWARRHLAPPPNVALGTDSRLTGARDLLDELRVAYEAASFAPADLLRMVTSTPARLLRLPEAGRLGVGSPADLFVIPPFAAEAAPALLQASRRDLELAVMRGTPRVGSPRMRPVFDARRTPTRAMAVDGVDKLADASLVRRVARSPIGEPGVVAR
jgi:cytosine/adenosine deaminase-related metal-dependent hydrolase